MDIRIPVTLAKCIRCNVAVDQHVMDFSTQLGPPEIECHWCGARVATGRMEWHADAAVGSDVVLFRHDAISRVGLLPRRLGGGTAGVELLDTGEWPEEWVTAEPAFWVSGGFTVVFVALIQGYRIYRSRFRQDSSKRRILRRSFSGFEVGGQVKMSQMVCLFRESAGSSRRFKLQPQPQCAIPPMVVACVGTIVGFEIWRRISLGRWAIRETDDRRAASELFELVTGNIDATQSLRWSYVLKNIPANRIDRLMRTVRSMGFAVDLPRIDREHDEYFLLTLSEECVHTVDSYVDRLTSIDYFAKSQKLELADCSVGR